MQGRAMFTFIFLVSLNTLAGDRGATNERPGFMGFGFTCDRAPDTKSPTAGWLTVRSLRPGHPAERAGLKIGDAIIELNSRKIEFADYLDVFLILETVKPRMKTPVTIIRSGKQQRLVIMPIKMGDAEWEEWKANVAMLRADRARKR